ncbi:MAG: MATE family efflux transporter [Spirochaetaceae bacterium]|jgi:putative MATE family efflux protein|nr:MATE family efflux transporter [Spirochaetaceae bacterium]
MDIMKPKNSYDLTEGSILKKITLVAIPIMGTQFLQMAYNLTDMFWLGRVGSLAVAASGAAGMYMWLSMGFLLIGRMGAEIGVAQSFGKGDRSAALDYSRNSLFINIVLGALYGVTLIVAARPLAAFFPVAERAVLDGASSYLRIIGFGVLPAFVTAVIAGTFNASGNSRVPFMLNSAGLLCNVILDPVCILILGLGIEGAALATIFSQCLVCTLMLIAVKRSRSRPFEHYPLRFRPDRKKITGILKWALPIGIESLLFCFLSMLCSRIEARFGAAAMAAGKIGSQVESLTWLIGGGFGSALVAFIGQNYGAGKTERIRRGVKLSLVLMAVWGALIVLFFCTAGKQVFYVFLPDREIAELGKYYLWIFAFCQIPMNVEAVCSGAFKGKGKTIPPSVAGAVSNSLKPLAAWFLSRTSLGLYGVWIGVISGDILRGLWLFIWYILAGRKERRAECAAA